VGSDAFSVKNLVFEGETDDTHTKALAAEEVFVISMSSVKFNVNPRYGTTSIEHKVLKVRYNNVISQNSRKC
jgi:hypothetical protein